MVCCARGRRHFTFFVQLIGQQLLLLQHLSNSLTFSTHTFFFSQRRYYYKEKYATTMNEKKVNVAHIDIGQDDHQDRIWAFNKSYQSPSLNHTVLPQSWKKSKYGQIYTIDLSAHNQMYKEVKARNQCRDGESCIRYVYNLGPLKITTKQRDKKQLNTKNNQKERKKILCLHRHKIWWFAAFATAVGCD